MIGGLDPKEVLKQRVSVQDDTEGFAKDQREVLDKEFEKMYNNFMESDFVRIIDNDEKFIKIKEFYDGLTLEKQKQFLRHCLIDMITIHMNQISQINQIQQSLFVDDFSDNIADALDSRWMKIFIYQIAGLAFTHCMPGPMQSLLETGKEENND